MLVIYSLDGCLGYIFVKNGECSYMLLSLRQRNLRVIHFFKNEFLLCKLLFVLLKVQQDLIVGLKRCHLKIRLLSARQSGYYSDHNEA